MSGELPVPLTTFVGRDAVAAQVVALLDDPNVRLLTLTGPGGIGKTRLAIEVAHRLEPDFADGARFVQLAALDDPSMVLPTLARSLAIPGWESQLRWETLIDEMRDRHLLLVVDNLEHLLDEPPTWLGELIGQCPRMTVLVTSQIPLNIVGEQRFMVPPLSLGEHVHQKEAPMPESIVLFEQRARALNPNFAVTTGNSADIAHICQQVDGLPLAIELAASRIVFLAPTEIATHLTSRLRLLTGGLRDVPPRLRSMRSAIEWSHDLLDSDERCLFRRLSVFTGSFTLEAAEAVCALGPLEGTDMLSGLASMLDHSLLRRMDGHPSRFAMLQVIKEYGNEQLRSTGEEAEIRERHAAWCLARASRIAPGPQQTEQPSLADIEHFEAEYDNVRGALEWLHTSERIDDLTELVGRLRSFWYLTERYAEAYRWLKRILAIHPDPPIELLRSSGQMAQLHGAPDAGKYLEAALLRARATGDLYQEAEARFHMGIFDEDRGAYAAARESFEAALNRYERVGNPLGRLQCAYHLAVVTYGQGDAVAARRLFEDVLRDGERAGDLLMPIWCRNYLTLIACADGDIAGAAELLHRQVHVLSSPALRHHVPDLLATVGVLAVARRQHQRAARLLGASGRSAYSLMLPEREAFERAVSSVRDHLGPADFEQEWRVGRRMSDPDIAIEVERVLDAQDEPASAPPAGDPAVTTLSDRELEVLRLVADGLTNQEIGKSLFVSSRTVASHMDHIYTKLDVRSRTAAVAYAIRHGLA